MTTSRSRIVAGVLIATGGFFIGVTALAIGLAELVVDAGIPAHAADISLLHDLVVLLPFVIGFAVVDLVAAVGLIAGRSWGPTVASGAAIVAVIVGLVGLLLVIAGNDPLISTASRAREIDGIGILGGFTGLFVAVLVALSIGRTSTRSGSRVAA